jgi:hypothetical protein
VAGSVDKVFVPSHSPHCVRASRFCSKNDLQAFGRGAVTHTLFKLLAQPPEPVAADVFSQKFKVRDLLGNISVNSFEADLLEASYEGVRQQIKTKLGETNIRENILLITDSPIPLDELSHANAHQFLKGLEI